MSSGRREFMGAGLGIGLAAALSRQLARAQTRQPPNPAANARSSAEKPKMSRGKVTKVFKSPEEYPNGLDCTSEGFWVADQVSDRVHLIDPDGKVLRTMQTDSHNTSGVAVGGGFIWLAANGPAREGHVLKLDKGLEREIVQADMNGKTIKHHEVPLGGGGITGVEFAEGKVWITSTRLAGLMQVDPATFQPEFMFALHMGRPHGLAWDNGFIWIVDGSDDQPSIMKANPKTGRIVEIVELSKGDPDPHGLAMYDGHLYYCDAGIHPGWPELTPQRGWVCRVDIENS